MCCCLHLCSSFCYYCRKLCIRNNGVITQGSLFNAYNKITSAKSLTALFDYQLTGNITGSSTGGAGHKNGAIQTQGKLIINGGNISGNSSNMGGAIFAMGTSEVTVNGGTYGSMPELFLKMYELIGAGENAKAQQIQNDVCRIIYKMCSGKGNLYAVMKAVIAKRGGPDCGSVRLPLAALVESDAAVVDAAAEMISAAIAKYC